MRPFATDRSSTVGQYTTRESGRAAHTFMHRKDAPLDGTTRGIIFCHAANQFGWAVDFSYWAMIAAYVYPLISCDLGDPAVASGLTSGPLNWANDNGLAHFDDVYAYLTGGSTGTSGTTGPGRSAAKPGKVSIIAGSMGVITGLAWARANPAKVAAVVGCIPAINLNDIYANDKGGLRAGIGAAYNVTYPTALPSLSTHSPIDGNPADYTSFPILLLPSDNDPVAANTATCQTWAATVNAAGGNVTVTSIGAQLHNFSATVPDPDIPLEFIAAHMAA